MGIFLTDVKLYAALVANGVELGEIGTLGRQFLLAEPQEVVRVLSPLGLDQGKLAAFVYSNPKWADDVFLMLGARSVTAIDYSDYEGASVVFDLNQRVDPALYEKFDTLHDGGTLEHVFNFPVALANIMLMVRVNGRVVLQKPANNQCGHGFYQFSPELFYRAFSEENGFVVETMAYTEVFRGGRSGGPFYDVVDPELVRTRVELDGGCPVNLVVVGRKIRHVQPFTTPPMQSDYVAAWNSGNERTRNMRIRERIVSYLDRAVPRGLQVARNILNPLRRSRFYTRHSVPTIRIDHLSPPLL